jgi:hypothetical protein
MPKPQIRIDAQPDGTFYYEMYDGPDGIEETKGNANTLGEVFEIIIVERTKTSISYV